MTTNRLTADERATFLIGQAFRRVMEGDKGAFPEATAALAWRAYAEVLTAALTPDEADQVMITTGLVGEGWIEFADAPEAAQGQAEPDEIPF
jgi:hypothetical protein